MYGFEIWLDGNCLHLKEGFASFDAAMKEAVTYIENNIAEYKYKGNEVYTVDDYDYFIDIQISIYRIKTS